MNIMMHLQKAFQEQFQPIEEWKSPGIETIWTMNKEPRVITTEQRELLQQAKEARKKFEEAKKRLDVLNDLLIDTFGPNSSIVMDDMGINISEKETITDIVSVKNYLGKRFDDLIETREEYTLSKKFKDLAKADPDLSQHIKISNVVTYWTKIKF